MALASSAPGAASAVLAGAWLLTAIVLGWSGRPGPARMAVLLAAAQAAVTVWPALAPVAIAAWLAGALALPDGRLISTGRRAIAATAFALAAAWSALLLITGDVSVGLIIMAALVAGAAAASGIAVRHRRASTYQRRAHQWVVAAAVVAVAADAVVLALHVLLDLPERPLGWVLGILILLPAGMLLGQFTATAAVAERALVEAIVAAGLTVLVVTVYLVVVVGLGRPPVGTERGVLVSSAIAALVVGVLALPVRFRLMATARTLLGQGGNRPEAVLAGFGARMTRSVPFDELLLQLAESLWATIGTAGAEVWVGSDGVLTTAVCVPDRPPGRLELDANERVVIGRTRIGGESWLSVWLPKLLAGNPDGALIRVAPAAYLGELLGLLVVRRPPEAPPFTDEDNRVLTELARQVGLAMHNVKLDSALQSSLDELQRRNEELRASRLRIVTAADAARRAIEHDLHDGAQQHLVALSVKLGLARQLLDADTGDGAASGLLDELRADVQDTIAAVRELAHGIYPPLLRNQGLGTALAAVARRSALRCSVSVELPSRYPEQIEAAVYFCCLEAIQNAGKHAGPDASLAVQVGTDDEVLRFSVTDDGAGFASGSHSPAAQGLVNMADRVGAVGGRLRIESAPGKGCSVLGDIPMRTAP
jgi:signal transduction histidine kinase